MGSSIPPGSSPWRGLVSGRASRLVNLRAFASTVFKCFEVGKSYFYLLGYPSPIDPRCFCFDSMVAFASFVHKSGAIAFAALPCLLEISAG